MATSREDIRGDLSVERNLDVGGEVRVMGPAVIERNLRVNGWVDAPNVVSPLKGYFADIEELRERYPYPEPGWWAICGSPGYVFTSAEGRWNNTNQLAQGIIGVPLDGFEERLSKIELILSNSGIEEDVVNEALDQLRKATNKVARGEIKVSVDLRELDGYWSSVNSGWWSLKQGLVQVGHVLVTPSRNERFVYQIIIGNVMANEGSVDLSAAPASAVGNVFVSWRESYRGAITAEGPVVNIAWTEWRSEGLGNILDAAGEMAGLADRIERNHTATQEKFSELGSTMGVVARGVAVMDNVSDCDNYLTNDKQGLWLLRTSEGRDMGMMMILVNALRGSLTQWLFGDIRLHINGVIRFSFYGKNEMIAVRTRLSDNTVEDWKVFDLGRAEGRLNSLESKLGGVTERCVQLEADTDALKKMRDDINLELKNIKNSVFIQSAPVLTEVRRFEISEIVDSEGRLLVPAYNPDIPDTKHLWRYGLGFVDGEIGRGRRPALEDVLLGNVDRKRRWFIYAFHAGTVVEQTESGAVVREPEMSYERDDRFYHLVGNRSGMTTDRVDGYFLGASNNFIILPFPMIVVGFKARTPVELVDGAFAAPGSSDFVTRVFDGDETWKEEGAAE